MLYLEVDSAKEKEATISGTVSVCLKSSEL